jgi:hypothetical protein
MTLIPTKEPYLSQLLPTLYSIIFILSHVTQVASWPVCAAGFASVIESESLPSLPSSNGVWRIIYPHVVASAGRPAYLRYNRAIAGGFCLPSLPCFNQ